MSVQKYLIICACFALCCTFLIGLVAFQNMYKAENAVSDMQTIPNSFPSATPNASEILNFKKRNINISKMFYSTIPYPTELSSASDNDLVPLSCTRHYRSDYSTEGAKYYPEYYGDDEKEKDQQYSTLSDPTLLDYIDKIQKKYSEKIVSEILSCSTEKGTTIILYSIGPCGGGCSGEPYIGVVENNEITEISSVPGDMAYYGCRRPIQLTKNNLFYFECGGGDGPDSLKVIYKLNLTTHLISKVKECRSGIDEKTPVRANGEDNFYTRCS